MPHIHSITAMFLLVTVCSSCRKPVIGCTDAAYGNYDPLANEDDGCCCSIVHGAYDDSLLRINSVWPFLNLPDSLEPTPFIDIEASVMRRDQIAQGPCGCLSGSLWGLNAGDYSPTDGIYGPRAICFTDISWACRTSPFPMDTAVWNLIAAVNGFDPDAHQMRICYTIHFQSVGDSTFERQFADTLYGFENYASGGSTVYINWGSYGYSAKMTHRLSGVDLPCSDYPIDNSSVTIDIDSVRAF